VHGNYGILSIDRPQVFNASYSYSFGKIYKGEQKVLSGAANNWIVSGVTTFQSGGNLQSESSQNLSLSLQQPVPGNTSKTEGLTTKTYFGTDADEILPITTCNPKSNLQAHQLLNLSCFSAPTVGKQGSRVLHPYLGGPIYTDTDLTIGKTINVTERQNVEFKAAAFNFMNHSLWGLSGNNLVSLAYQSNDGGKTFFTNAWGYMNQKTPYSGAGYGRIIELSVKYNF